MPDSVDALITARLIVAWAGEGGESPRLGWWRTDLTSEFGGRDLFRRLLPATWRWAALEAVWEAARRADARLRSRTHDPDTMRSLFSLGFELDERALERFGDLKAAFEDPLHALAGLGAVISEEWNVGRFKAWVEQHGTVRHAAEPVGRRILGTKPDSLREAVGQLVGALQPLTQQGYPLPYFREPA